MRRFLTALVLLLALYVTLSRFTEVEQVANTLRNGDFLWLGLALFVQICWLVNNAVTYKATYRLLGIEASVEQLLPLAVTSNFINTIAPSAGVGGMAIFISDARQRNISSARVTIAGVLYVLFDYFAFLCVLTLGLAVLFRRNHLTAVEIGATAVLLVVALSLGGLLYLGASSPPTFERVLIGSARFVNRLLHPVLRHGYLSEERAHLFAAETAEGLSALRAGARDYLVPASLALVGKGLLVGMLALVFLAFEVPFSAGTIIGGFSIGYLFMIVSPTPAGIGVVEGAMTIALTTLRVPLGAATLITLAYRGLTFWLPFAYGFVALRVLEWQWRKHALEKTIP